MAKTAKAMDKMSATFGNNIKVARASKNLSQYDLARLANIKPLNRISSMEENRAKITIREVISICTALDVPMESMLKEKAKLVIKFV